MVDSWKDMVETMRQLPFESGWTMEWDADQVLLRQRAIVFDGYSRDAGNSLDTMAVQNVSNRKMYPRMFYRATNLLNV